MRWLIPLIIMLAGCPQAEKQTQTSSVPAAEQRALTVWADPALSVPLEALTADFTKLHRPGLDVRYVEREELLEAVDGGEPADPPDVYLFADQRVLETFREAGAVDESSTRTFAGDRLVVACRLDEGWKTASLFDVYKLRFTGFGLAGENTSLGHYSAQALHSEGVRSRIEKRIVSFSSLDKLLAGLADDEVQLMLVFASTVTQRTDLQAILIVGEDLHEDIRYVAASSGQRNDPAVIEFLRFLAEDEDVQQKLMSYGLIGRTDALVENR
jgi:molybdenum ABC transporter molybdate-binding protein